MLEDYGKILLKEFENVYPQWKNVNNNIFKNNAYTSWIYRSAKQDIKNAKTIQDLEYVNIAINEIKKVYYGH
jgi:hypothetical protein